MLQILHAQTLKRKYKKALYQNRIEFYLENKGMAQKPVLPPILTDDTNKKGG